MQVVQEQDTGIGVTLELLSLNQHAWVSQQELFILVESVKLFNAASTLTFFHWDQNSYIWVTLLVSTLFISPPSLLLVSNPLHEVSLPTCCTLTRISAHTGKRSSCCWVSSLRKGCWFSGTLSLDYKAGPLTLNVALQRYLSSIHSFVSGKEQWNLSTLKKIFNSKNNYHPGGLKLQSCS